MIGYLDPVADRAAIEAYRRAGMAHSPLVRTHRCIRMVADPADRPKIERGIIGLVMQSLQGAGWEQALNGPAQGEGEP